MEPRRRRWDSFLRDLILAWFYLNSSVVIARNVERYDTAYGCEGKVLIIECREGELIHLIRANYGRFSITICNEHGNTDWSVNCMSTKSFRVLYNMCNQKQNCSINATTTQFGDPCPSTLKYLEAHYQCVSAATTTTSTRPSPPSWILTSQPSVWSTVSPVSRSPSRITTSAPSSGGGGGGGSSQSARNSSAVVGAAAAAVPSTSSTPRSSSSSSTSTSRRDEESGEEEEDEDEEEEDEAEEDAEEEDEEGVGVGGGGEEDAISAMKPNRPTAPGVSAETTASALPPPPLQPQAPFTSTVPPWKTGRRTPTGKEGGPRCPGLVARKLAWNATRLGEVAVQNCPGGAQGLARWQCSWPAGPDRPGEALWRRGTPDLSECRSLWLTSLEKQVQEGEVILGVSRDLSQVTNNSRGELYGGDILITTKILRNMAERMAQDVDMYQDPRQREVSLAELLQGAVTTGSNLLDRAQSASWRDLSHQEQMLVATSLLIGLEENAFLLAETLSYEKNITHERPNILMEVRVLDARNLDRELEVFPREPRQQDRWSRLQDRVELTRGALLESSSKNDKGLVRLVFMAFDRLEEILQPELDDSSLSINEERKSFGASSAASSGSYSLVEHNVTRIINSKVISASLGKGKHVQLAEPVRLYFQHLVRENVTNPRCVFWDYTISGWSEEGCITQESNETHTICECKHLTNFAVLMDVHAVKLDVAHQVALQIITYVGCIVSIICLVLAIITFQLFRGLKSDRTTIHKNLCVCLLIAEVLFICGIGQTNPRIVCGIVAGLLHFFFLCAFAWMFLEGFQLYVMLIEVFEAEKSRLRWYYLVAYGAPFLVVVVSCVIDPLSYGTDRYCWLRADNYFIFSFVGPVILVILANLVFLSMAIYMMCRHANTTVSMKSKEHSRLASASGKEENALPNKLQAHLAWLRGAIVLVFLLGLTWTFGLLYLNQESVAMAYIFTVLNSLQGLFIFVFHCVQNEKVRKEYRKFIRRHSWLPKCLRCSKDASSSGSGSGSGGAGTSGANAGLHSGKDYASHNASSNPSGPTTDSSGLSPPPLQSTGAQPPASSSSGGSSSMAHQHHHHHHPGTGSNNISFKSHPRDLEHEFAGGGGHNAMTLQGYSLRARERRLLAELEIGSRATTGRRAASPYNHFYTEIREQQLQQQQQHQQQHVYHHHHHLLHHHHLHHQQQQQDDPVYEEIERATGQASDMSDEDGRRQSDMSRQSSRSYGDHRPLIPYSPGAERGGLEAAWAIERLRRQQQQQQQQHHQQQQQQQQQQLQHLQPQQLTEQQQQQLRPAQDHTRTVAVLDGHTVVCHLQPQAELYAARGLAPPSYSEC